MRPADADRRRWRRNVARPPRGQPWDGQTAGVALATIALWQRDWLREARQGARPTPTAKEGTKSRWQETECGLTKQANRRTGAAAKPRTRDVRVERRVRPHTR